MDSTRSRSHAPRTSGSRLGFQALGIFFLLAVVGLAIWFDGRTRDASAGTKPAASAPADPFAGLPPDPSRAGHTASPSASTAKDPFGSLPSVTDQPTWKDALALVEKADRLIGEAEDARDAGRKDEAQKKGKEAQDLLDQAIQTTRSFEDDLAKERGRDDAEVMRITSTRSAWVRKVMALQKTAGI